MKKLPLPLICGALGGVVYGLMEYVVVIMGPMLRWRPRSLGPAHWVWEAAFLSLYVLLGAAIGGATAIFQKKESPRAATRMVVVAASLALAADHILFEGRTAANLVLVAALVLMAMLVCGSIFVSNSSVWQSWMCSPWVSVPLMLAIVTLKSFLSRAGMLSAAILGLWAGVSLIVWLASRNRLLRRALQNRFLPLTAPACGILLVALVSLSLALEGTPRIPAARAAGPTPRTRPNVLLIVLDTVRADHLSVYGYARKTTPEFDARAHDWVLFRNAVSTSDMTLSSHASLFTGLYPSWHGSHVTLGDAPPLARSFHTLAEVLSENGYTTMAVLANSAFLRPEFGLNQGFDLYDVRSPVSASGSGRECLRGLLARGLNHFRSTAELYRSYRRADEITDDSLRIFDAMRTRASPFFLALNYMDAHDPYIPPPPYRDFFPGRNPQFDHVGRVRELHRELAFLRTSPTTAADLRHIESQYDGAVAYLDAQLKRLLDGLKQSGLYDNTLIVVTSDHGEALGERSVLGHPGSVHQELVHVPLLLKFPGPNPSGAARQIEAVASGVDVMPTVLDVAGLDIPANLQGHSLRKLSEDAPGFVIAESFPNYLSRFRHRSDLAQRAIYQGHWKFIGSTSGQKDLYDLSRDPGELQNLYNSDDPSSRRLNEQLDQWIQAIPLRKVPPDKLDPQTLKRLRSLGYMQ